MNRRNWLKLTGISGAASLIGANAMAASTDYPAHPTPGNSIIKLSSNENPYGPSPRVREAMRKAFDQGCRYPFSTFQEMKEMLAEKLGVNADHVLITPGSREGLQATGLAYGINGGEIIAANPVYKSLLTYAEHIGAYIHRVPVDKDLQHDLDAMEKRITQSTKLVFVCNPNNPTGSLLPAKQLESFCDKVSDRAIVFSDEAYFDYIKTPDYPSMIELVKQDKNVIVSRTFSKVYGMAGIRMGYLVSRPDIIQRLSKYCMAWPNILAIAGAKEALKDDEFYKFSLTKNEEGKQMIYQMLDSKSMPYVNSHTNFVFFKTGKPIATIQNAFMNKNIRVGRAFPPLTDWCRISIGTVDEVRQFCDAANEIFI